MDGSVIPTLARELRRHEQMGSEDSDPASGYEVWGLIRPKTGFKRAENTAIWLHIGLNDSEQRVLVTRDAYNFLSDYHNSPDETTSAVSIEGYTGTTYSLMINGDDQFKRTEYENIGHGVAAFPFKDPYLIEWLFRHSL